MNLLKCSKGHFYDGDRYADCPHCNTHLADSMTISMPSGGSKESTTGRNMEQDGEPVTMAKPADDEPATVAHWEALDPSTQGSAGGSSYEDINPVILDGGSASGPDDEGVTLSYFSRNISPEVKAADPVVGWLVCRKGEYFGQSFSLKSGRNFVGRSPQMDICLLNEPSVSRDRHAVIIYEPVGRIFLAQAGDSRELFYVNDNVVLDNVQLKPYDVISVGKTDLFFIPCCTKEFSWDDLEKDAK